MSFDSTESDLSTPTVFDSLNPEKPVPRYEQPDGFWFGDVHSTGLREKLPNVISDKGLPKIIQEVDANLELRQRVVARYQSLLGTLNKECIKSGIPSPMFTDQDRAELILMGCRIESSGRAYCQRVRRITSEKFTDDPEKANLIAERMIGDYISTEKDIIDHLVDKTRQRNLDNTEKQTKIKSVQEDPRKTEWTEMGTRWITATPEVRQKILDEIASGHQSSISAVVRDEKQQPDFVYFYLNAHNPDLALEHRKRSAGVNNAQDKLLGNVIHAGSREVVNFPTKDLRTIFNELETIGKEVKVHLQPKLEDEPMVIDRLMTLLNRNPELRDGIGPIKFHIKGNCQADPSGLHLPEIVIYTDDLFRNQILEALRKEFCDLEGNGLTPRFNREVANKLIYVAQSGGDLKQSLQDLGLLDKFFDKESNYAQMRV